VVRFLELRIPPPIVGITIAAGMWVFAHMQPVFQWPKRIRLLVAIAFCVIGVAIAIGGVLSFRRARTTVNPLKPESSAALVSTGVYAFTRNPMYVGMVLIVIGWAIYLSSFWALPGPVLYGLYLTRFQIIPEERALTRLFGSSFTDYRQRVRRWL
jgi:protein-S-isoprenylcysteine O-methyltransferase Ste14